NVSIDEPRIRPSSLKHSFCSFCEDLFLIPLLSVFEDTLEEHLLALSNLGLSDNSLTSTLQSSVGELSRSPFSLTPMVKFLNRSS
nr:hypothetical protein [Tanacetum cinerariifolium]